MGDDETECRAPKEHRPAGSGPAERQNKVGADVAGAGRQASVGICGSTIDTLYNTGLVEKLYIQKVEKTLIACKFAVETVQWKKDGRTIKSP
jgi:hypothetical protein